MNKAILIFGAAKLQRSLIERAHKLGLKTIGVDPDPNAECKNILDDFEVVSGNDFEGTLEIAKKHKVAGIITAATDKPLVMMARVAETLRLPFFPVKTAVWSTDKLLMKQKFQEAEIPCATGFLVNKVGDLKDVKVDYPVIVKPRDNSGSRGVIYCRNLNEVEISLSEALKYTHKENVLIEEFIEGKEYSIEALHYNNESHIIQTTEKITTTFPYNVELGHKQPADISTEQYNEIHSLILKTAKALGFSNCASHTEIKINSKGIFVIESSPRLGGDFISSTLVPLSTGTNMEDILIHIAIGIPLADNYFTASLKNCSGIIYFELPEGIITSIAGLEELNRIKGIQVWKFNLQPGDKVNEITSSLNRYGYAIFQTQAKEELDNCFKECKKILDKIILVES